MAIPTRSRASSAATESNSNSNSNSDSDSSAASIWLSKQNTWSSADEAISEENLGPVLESLLSEHSASSASQIVTAAKVFKQLADMSRSPQARHTLTDTELPKATCTLLETTTRELSSRSGADESERAERVFLLVQLLRCICNLSADNDACRGKILEYGGISSLSAILGSIDEVWVQPMPVGQAAFAAALNVSLHNTECTKALIDAGALLPHLKALRPEAASEDTFQIWPLVCMSLDNMCEDELAKAQFGLHSDYALTVLRSLAKLSRMLSDAENASNDNSSAIKGAQRTLLWILCEALEKSAKVREQLCHPESVLSLFDILDFYLAKGAAAIEEEADDEDDEDDEDSQTQAGSSSSIPQPLPPNKPIPQTTNRFADAITQVVVAISGEDSALEVLFESQSLINRLVTVLTADRSSTKGDDSRGQRLDGMAAAAALCLGNLARTEEHCTKLVSEHPALIRTLIHELFSSKDTNVRTRHAASGLLKNLCLPAVNKLKMVEFGLVPVAAASIDTAVVPVQANAIGILRHLSNGGSAAHTVLQLVEQPLNGKKTCALVDLLKVVKETDVDGIRCEGTRLVANIVKRSYLRKDQGALYGSGELALLDHAREIVDAQAFDLVTPLIRLILLDGQRHPLLQQESLVALTILASTSTEASRHVGDMVRLLNPSNSVLPDAIAGSDSAEDAEKAPSPPKKFAEVLESLAVPDGRTWPQTMLQAKSFIKQLAISASKGSDLDGDGINTLQTKLVPLAGAAAVVDGNSNTPTKQK